MNNYDEIALEAIKQACNTDEPFKFALMNETVYKCAYEAAKLQAERFNKDLDASYTKYLESIRAKEYLN